MWYLSFMNKGQFSTSQEYDVASRNRQYVGRDPIDPEVAGRCLRDRVVQLGDSPATTGACPLASECDYANDKIAGVSGFCLKQAVGVVI